MPNIDTTKIDGFDTMTDAEKVTALLGFEIPEQVDMSKMVSKEIFDKKATEAASLSKQLREKMTEDEAKRADDDKALAELRSELETLRKDKTISEYTAKYIALGYDAELAKDTAKAMADGDMEKVFKNGEAHKAALEKKIREDLLNKTPKPGGAGGEDKQTDSAVEKARAIAKARHGNDKSFNDIVSKYKK